MQHTAAAVACSTQLLQWHAAHKSRPRGSIPVGDQHCRIPSSVPPFLCMYRLLLLQVLVQATCLQPFLEPPHVQLRYTVGARQVVQDLALPLAPHKFMVPEPSIAKEAFFEKWKSYAGVLGPPAGHWGGWGGCCRQGIGCQGDELQAQQAHMHTLAEPLQEGRRFIVQGLLCLWSDLVLVTSVSCLGSGDGGAGLARRHM
jgi:hypothetical protein